MTLNGRYRYVHCFKIPACFGANHENLHGDRPTLSAAKMWQAAYTLQFTLINAASRDLYAIAGLLSHGFSLLYYC